jgi:hypothetical protein
LETHGNKSTSFEAASLSFGPWIACSKASQPNLCNGPCHEPPSAKELLDLAIA